MATIIDELVVQLGLDPTGFIDGQKRADESVKKTKEGLGQYAKDMEDKTKSIGESIGGVTRKLVELAAAYLTTSAVTSFIRDTTSANIAVGQFAATLGISVEKMSQYRQAAKLANISPDAMAGSIQSVTQNLARLPFGQVGDQFYVAASRLGMGSMFGPDGKPISWEEFLRRAGRGAQGAIKSGQYSTAQVTGLLGDLGINSETAYIIEKTDGSLQKFLDTSRRLGVENEKQFKTSLDVGTAWGKLEGAAAELGRTVMEDLNDPLVKLLDILTKISQWFTDHKKVFEVLAGVIAGAGFGAGAGFLTPIPGGTLGGMVAGGIAGGVEAYGWPDKGHSKTTGPGSEAPLPSGPMQGFQTLKQDRERYLNAFEANPALKEKFFHEILGENNNPDAQVALMETFANRASTRGYKNPLAELTGEKGRYFAGWAASISPAQHAKLEDAYNKVFRGGADTSHGAIDNSSSWLADKHIRNNEFGDTIPAINGEHFEIPARHESQRGDRENRNAWYGRMKGGSESWPGGGAAPWNPHTVPSGGQSPSAPWYSGAWEGYKNLWGKALHPSTILHNQSNNISHSQSTSSVHVENINVATAARNAYELTDGLADHMKTRFSMMNGNTGIT